MLVLLLPVLIPLAGAVAALSWRSRRTRPRWLPLTFLAHLAACLALCARGAADSAPGWIAIDPPGRLILPVISLLFLVCSIYAVGYLGRRGNQKNRIFCTSLALLGGMLSLLVISNHLGLMWVAMESATLSSAPLLYFNRSVKSLEATWKYLMVSSVGIALALLGSLFVGYAAELGGGSSLLFSDLVHEAGALSRPWLRAGFVCLAVGYGTKMGLAPMHTWKPDAYGEAPGLAGALFAGCITSGAFLALTRVYRIVAAAGDEAFAGRILILFGLLSMAVAGVFMIQQKDFKRMLAYSSVEHMGILALGLGLGGSGIFGALLHLINNALVKGVLFLSAGNLHRGFGSKSTEEVSGALRVMPWSAGLFLVGFIAVTGSPPFGPFVSEFAILTTAFVQQRAWIAALMLVFLLIVFIGMGLTVLHIVQGPPARAEHGRIRELPLLTLPALFLLLSSLVMGVAMPGAVRSAVEQAALYVSGRP